MALGKMMESAQPGAAVPHVRGRAATLAKATESPWSPLSLSLAVPNPAGRPGACRPWQKKLPGTSVPGFALRAQSGLKA